MNQKENRDLFKKHLEKLEKDIEQLKNMSNREFRKEFSGTSFARAGRKGVLKNLTAILK